MFAVPPVTPASLLAALDEGILTMATVPPTMKAKTDSPISRLPAELLIEIFALCSLAASPDPYIPLTISKVCSFWREVLWISPRAWQFIRVQDSDRSIASIRSQIELWIARSAPLPFDLHLELADTTRLLPIISCFFPHLDRWRNCTIATEGNRVLTSFPNLIHSAPCRTLHRLDINVRGSDDIDDDEILLYSCGSTAFRHISMRIFVPKLPLAHTMNPLHFTHLNIAEHSFEHTFEENLRSSELLDFLAACPQLEHLHLQGTSFDEGSSPYQPTPRVVSLPRLQKLMLRCMCTQRSILSHLHTPALRELHLISINIDLMLSPYHATEEGDSDDEAHDFSQSPWSDHQTGMGLRKLLTRSNPPLEVLDMDLSDMRTKDFRWVFDKLENLKHFSIIGSDMSNKVIQFFKPMCLLEDGDGVNVRVRMPRLRTLKLYSCQQFSGEALVDALSKRILFTDKATPGSTLTEVVISDCRGFTPRHAQDLSWSLRNRLHWS